jgi:CheY-like chemotaxis protein
MAKRAAVAQMAPAPAASPAPPTTAPAHSVHVLIVDDESVIRTAVRQALEDAGYTVHEAPDGQIAMDMLLLSPDPLVVVLDLMMPRMAGTEVLELLATEPVWARRHTVVVLTAMSRWLTSKYMQPLRERLAVRLVAKPFDVEELLEAVAEAARRLPPA